MNELQDVMDDGDVAVEAIQSPEKVSLSVDWWIHFVIPQHISAVLDIQAS